MGTLPTFAKLGFKDDSGRIAEVTYRLYFDLQDDYSNFEDIAINLQDIRATAAQASSSRVEYAHLIIEFPGQGVAEDYSNNQVVAFTRANFNDGSSDSFEVPSWDASLYDQDANNIMNEDYANWAVGFAQFIAKRDGSDKMDNASLWSQSRARKGRQTVG